MRKLTLKVERMTTEKELRTLEGKMVPVPEEVRGKWRWVIGYVECGFFNIVNEGGRWGPNSSKHGPEGRFFDTLREARADGRMRLAERQGEPKKKQRKQYTFMVWGWEVGDGTGKPDYAAEHVVRTSLGSDRAHDLALKHAEKAYGTTFEYSEIS